jgi:hypothetical protein
MIIQLNDKFRIVTLDSRNWALQRLNVAKKEGAEDKWVNVSYFSSLTNALHNALTDPVVYMDMKTKKECEEWLENIKTISDNLNK